MSNAEEFAARIASFDRWKAALLHVPMVSNVRLKHGEPHVSFVLTGPKGGGAEVIQIDLDTAKALMLRLGDEIERGGTQDWEEIG